MREKAKQVAGEYATKFVKNNMIVGLGSGSTVRYFIEALSKKCREGLKIQTIAASTHSEKLARELNIPLLKSDSITYLDLTVDGADEIDEKGNMIKGGGGALLREKILAYSSKEMIVIIDESKQTSCLGKIKLPVEISSFCFPSTIAKISRLGLEGKVRVDKEKNALFITDNGNYIFDIEGLYPMENPQELHHKLISIPGILETGLFFQCVNQVVVGKDSGSILLIAVESHPL